MKHTNKTIIGTWNADTQTFDTPVKGIHEERTNIMMENLQDELQELLQDSEMRAFQTPKFTGTVPEYSCDKNSATQLELSEYESVEAVRSR